MYEWPVNSSRDVTCVPRCRREYRGVLPVGIGLRECVCVCFLQEGNRAPVSKATLPRNWGGPFPFAATGTVAPLKKGIEHRSRSRARMLRSRIRFALSWVEHGTRAHGRQVGGRRNSRHLHARLSVKLGSCGHSAVLSVQICKSCKRYSFKEDLNNSMPDRPAVRLGCPRPLRARPRADGSAVIGMVHLRMNVGCACVLASYQPWPEPDGP